MSHASHPAAPCLPGSLFQPTNRGNRCFFLDFSHVGVHQYSLQSQMSMANFCSPGRNIKSFLWFSNGHPIPRKAADPLKYVAGGKSLPKVRIEPFRGEDSDENKPVIRVPNGKLGRHAQIYLMSACCCYFPQKGGLRKGPIKSSQVLGSTLVDLQANRIQWLWFCQSQWDHILGGFRWIHPF